jgi:uncharacterized protein (TIGR02996 family)
MARYELAGSYWTIARGEDGVSLTTTSGKRDEPGRSTTRRYPSAAAAEAKYDALVLEKLRAGYQLVAAPPASAPPFEADAAALEARIYDDPDDVATYAVYGDLLQRRGDPRGELIALQCQPMPLTAKQEVRVRHLVDTHGRRWLAALGEHTILKDGLVYERGFVAKCRVYQRSYGDVTRSIGHRLWATVREAEVETGSAIEELLDPVCASLRVLRHVSTEQLEVIEHTGRALPLESLGVDGLGDRHLAVLGRLGRRTFPALRELHLNQAQSRELLCDVLAALGPLDRVTFRHAPDVAVAPVLDAGVAELVFYHPTFHYRIARAEPTVFHVRHVRHGWPWPHELRPLPGASRVVLTLDRDDCETCTKGRLTPAQLANALGCPVELELA